MENLQENLDRLLSQLVGVLHDDRRVTHKFIDSETTTKDPFSLGIHEIILGRLIGCPLILGDFVKCGEPIPEFNTLLF